MAAGKRTDIPTLLVLVAMYVLFLGNAALYYTVPLHPVLHVFLGALAIHLAFTVWHEAAHGTVSSKPWVNDVVGVVGMLPYMTPYFIQRWVHLQHHDKLNEPDDPNLLYTSGSFLTILVRYPKALGYAKKILKTDPRTTKQRVSDYAGLALVGGIYAAAILTGHGVDLLVLWFIPLVIAKIVMDYYINYLPHAGLPPHPFGGTRVVDVGWFTPLVLGHNYHAVHHVWPPVPWHQYRTVYRRKLDYLTKNGVVIEHRVFGDFGRRPGKASGMTDSPR
jgi:fatty acid desaturase